MSETTTFNPVTDGSKPMPKKKSPRTSAVPGTTNKSSGSTKRNGGSFLEKKANKFGVISSNGG